MKNDSLYFVQHVLVFVLMAMGFCLRRDLLEPQVAYPIMVSCVCMLAVVWFLVKPRYREYIYVPERDEELPQRIVAEWDKYTNDFELLGFRRVGNFRLQDDPLETHARYYLSDDPRIRGEIAALSDEFTPSFCTVFEDGRMIESAIHPTVATMCHPDENLWFIAQESGTLYELFDRHRRAVDTYERETGFDAIAITPDRLYGVAQYGHRLVWWKKNQTPRHLGPPQPLPKVAEPHYASAS